MGIHQKDQLKWTLVLTPSSLKGMWDYQIIVLESVHVTKITSWLCLSGFGIPYEEGYSKSIEMVCNNICKSTPAGFRFSF